MATPSYGANTWFGFGEESTWGDAASRTDFLELVSSTLKVEKNIGFSRVARGLDPQRSYDQLVIARGEIVTELGYEGWLKLFKHLLGDTTTNAITAMTSYRHEFARAAALPTGLSIEVEHDQQNFLFEGCRIAQLAATFSANDTPTLSWSITGETGTDNAAGVSTFSAPTDLPVLPSQLAVTIGGTDYSADVSSVGVTIGNALDGERRRIGSSNPKQPVRSSSRPDVVITVEMEHNSDTDALAASYLAGTDVEFTLTATGAAISGGGGENYLFKVECPTCEITDAFPTVNDPGILPMTVTLQAKDTSASSSFDNDSGQTGAVKVTLQNTEASI